MHVKSMNVSTSLFLSALGCCSVTQSCLTLCNPMNRSKPGLPVHHQLLEFTQTHVHRVSECHPAISSSVVPFSSCPQSLPASESFPMSQLFACIEILYRQQAGGPNLNLFLLKRLFPQYNKISVAV